MGDDSLCDGDIAFCVSWSETGYSLTEGYVVVVEEIHRAYGLTMRSIRKVVATNDGLAFDYCAADGFSNPIPISSAIPGDLTPKFRVIGLVYSFTSNFKVMK